MTKYAKALAAIVTAVIGWGFIVVSSSPAHITASEWMGLAVAVATALGVYAIPNRPVDANQRQP